MDARRAYGMLTPMSPGCYHGWPSGTYRLIVINQLPKTPETLLARTMGSGATLREALDELDLLPSDAREHTLAGPRIVQLRIALTGDPSPEAQEIVMQTQKIYDKLMKEQLNLGREQGLGEGLRNAILQACATRGLKLTATQRAKLAAEADTTVLLEWHRRALTAARVSEIFASG